MTVHYLLSSRHNVPKAQYDFRHTVKKQQTLGAQHRGPPPVLCAVGEGVTAQLQGLPFSPACKCLLLPCTRSAASVVTDSLRPHGL